MATSMNRKIATWFAIGFAITFIALALLVKTFVMAPSGMALMQVPLWRYYLHEIPHLFGPQTLGPASASGGGLFVMALQHVGLALVGGTMVATVAWWLGRRST